MVGMRRLAVITVVVLLAMPGTGVANNAPRLPTSAAEWADFSAAQQAAAMDYLRQQLEEAIASGRPPERAVSGSNDAGIASIDTLAAISVTYSCQIQWIDLGYGMWVRGGGWTDASATIYYIYASRQGLKGKFLRDGSLLEYWWNEVWNGDHAENWTDYYWRWGWEPFNSTTKGWHGARQTQGGTWLLGPDRYCTVS